MTNRQFDKECPRRASRYRLWTLWDMERFQPVQSYLLGPHYTRRTKRAWVRWLRSRAAKRAPLFLIVALLSGLCAWAQRSQRIGGGASWASYRVFGFTERRQALRTSVEYPCVELTQIGRSVPVTMEFPELIAIVERPHHIELFPCASEAFELFFARQSLWTYIEHVFRLTRDSSTTAHNLNLASYFVPEPLDLRPLRLRKYGIISCPVSDIEIKRWRVSRIEEMEHYPVSASYVWLRNKLGYFALMITESDIGPFRRSELNLQFFQRVSRGTQLESGYSGIYPKSEQSQYFEPEPGFAGLFFHISRERLKMLFKPLKVTFSFFLAIIFFVFGLVYIHCQVPRAKSVATAIGFGCTGLFLIFMGFLCVWYLFSVFS